VKVGAESGKCEFAASARVMPQQPKAAIHRPKYPNTLAAASTKDGKAQEADFAKSGRSTIVDERDRPIQAVQRSS